MDFGEQQAQIAGYKTEEIYWHLEQNPTSFGKSGLFLLCDQLLQRKQPIRFVKQHFERIVRDLPVQRLIFLERFDHAFSKAAVQVAYQELRRRNKKVSEWFWHNGEGQQGPLNREQLDNRIEQGQVKPEHYVWKEGWEEWKKFADVSYLSEKLYYQQDLPKTKTHEGYQGPPPMAGTGTSSSQSTAGRQGPGPIPDRGPSSRNYQSATGATMSSGLSITAGILTLVGFPIWLIVTILTPGSSFNEPTGLFLPTAFALFMVLASIPFGIGILLRKYWAYWSKLVCAAIAVVWMISKMAFYGGSRGWMWILLLEGLIGTFLFLSREDFNQERL